MAINDVFMLPKRVRSMEQMADLLQTEQAELTQTSRAIAALQSQLLISTSTFLLPRHERIFDLPTNTEESLSIRRARLLAKLNTRGSTTVKAIKEMVKIVTGCEADVIEHPSDYTFEVIVHLRFPDQTGDLQELISRIEEIKPAHLLLFTEGAVEPIILRNINKLALYSLAVRLRVNNFGVESVYLDGRRNLDGAWVLKQLFTKGISLQRLTVLARAGNKNNQAHSFLTHAGIPNLQQIRCRSLLVFTYRANNLGVAEYLLDGRLELDGSWKLAQTYSKGLALRRLTCALRLYNPQMTTNALTLKSRARSPNSAATGGKYTAAEQNRAGVDYNHFCASVHFPVQQRVAWYVTTDTMYYLDGSTQLAGGKMLNAAITRSEV